MANWTKTMSTERLLGCEEPGGDESSFQKQAYERVDWSLLVNYLKGLVIESESQSDTKF